MAHEIVSNLEVYGTLTATSFVGDGSGLTNISGSGSGSSVDFDGNYFEYSTDGASNPSTTPFNEGNYNTNSTTPYTVTESSVSSGQSGWLIFDNDAGAPTSRWQAANNVPSGSASEWVLIEGVNKAINKYRIKNDGLVLFAAIRAWKLQGRIGAGSFVDLSSETNSSPSAGWSDYYTFDNDTVYDDYRLLVTNANNQKPIVQELELIEATEGLTLKDSSIGGDKLTSDIDITTTGDVVANSFSTTISTANTSVTPTDAELDSAFGTPSIVGSGFTSVINVSGAGSNLYQVISDGTNWWYSSFTKAT